ncbi:MAG: hypothetical protein JRJ43_09060 [Deltaproteobacteria bacterium]|nr:hypothetical protein [Deltaproteobacteria bacterium]MBW1719697.1 hypothetical protein [Deltaproteobacteria bacterium]MBW1938707.1 hypothetical protein [Deltaproteobacteria bacterium]MBW2350838.1 hypothetical protein [Deltaproteobacteria bacterium]
MMAGIFRSGPAGNDWLLKLPESPTFPVGFRVNSPRNEDRSIIEKAFGVTVPDDKCFIPKIMSRKKEFIPRIGRFLTG